MIYGDPNPHWPLNQKPKKWTAGGSFNATRDNGVRHHPAIDLGAPFGTDVLATEDQVLTYKQNWDSKETAAVFGYSPITNTTIVYGAIYPESNLPIGTEVKKGQKIATVGRYEHGSTMVHCEQWLSRITPTIRLKNTWKGQGTPKPELLLDITPYILRAMGNSESQVENSAVKGDDSSEATPTNRDYIGPIAIIGLSAIAYFSFKGSK